MGKRHGIPILTLLMSAQLAGAQRSDTVVRVAGAPRYAGVATLIPELTISSADAPVDYQFDGIRSMLAARDGSVWVVDGRYASTNASAPTGALMTKAATLLRSPCIGLRTPKIGSDANIARMHSR